MTTIIQITQIILGCAVILLLLVFVAAAIFVKVDEILAKHHALGQQSQFEKDRENLRSAAAWFGECEATQNLIRTLATDSDIWQAREKWRSAKAQQNSVL